MDWSQSYEDTCAELRILQLREMEVRRMVELAHKVIVTGEAPSSGDYVHISLDKGIERYNQAVDELDKIQAEVDAKESIKLEMEKAMEQFTGLEHVVKCKVLQGKSYKVIAEELGYGYQYIRNYMSKRGYKKGTISPKAS